ncbi:hypothetical protein Dsin_020201 [Dipteronia sinensis]|uniref:Uncharacterized protein n=1 Tax=Dipteronia sinensis TaxID=43782 RepID=A0AAE0E3F7_9ROSI|nr:hypothetical protein Dsin_020201 [Dipteronia sinensis]
MVLCSPKLKERLRDSRITCTCIKYYSGACCIRNSGEQGECGRHVLEGEKSIEDEQQVVSLGTEEDMEVEGNAINEDVADIVEEPLDDQVSTPLPVLFVEDGSVILSKDIANFHRPKALWYPHDNEVAVKEQGKLPTPRAHENYS